MVEAVAALPGAATLLAGQIRYQVRLLLRTPRAVWGGVGLPLLLVILRHRGTHDEAAVVTGAAAFGLVSIAYVTHATGMVSARETGVLKRWRATPLPRWCFFAGRIAATVTLAAASALVAILAAVALYHLHLTALGVLSLLVAVVLGALAWSAVGTAMTALVSSVDAAWPLLALSYLPIMFISGAFGSLGGVSWLTRASEYLPAQPVIEAAARAVHGHSGLLLSLSARDLAVLLGWTALGLIVSLRRFRWEPTPPRRRRAPGRRSAAPGQVPPTRAG